MEDAASLAYEDQEDNIMARVTLIVTVLVIALVAVFAGTTAAQTDTRDRTFLTFSGPVEMPGVTLPTGTYVFKLADTPSRNVVEVWDREEKKMMGHWLFVQAQRPDCVAGDRRDVQGNGCRSRHPPCTIGTTRVNGSERSSSIRRTRRRRIAAAHQRTRALDRWRTARRVERSSVDRVGQGDGVDAGKGPGAAAAGQQRSHTRSRVRCRGAPA
jgi:hypothetical protein